MRLPQRSDRRLTWVAGVAVVAALHDGSIVSSDSGGMTWEVRAIP